MMKPPVMLMAWPVQKLESSLTCVGAPREGGVSPRAARPLPCPARRTDQELDRLRDLLRLGEPLHRDALPAAAHAAVVGVPLRLHVHVHDLLDALARHRAGAHGVHAHAGVHELVREGLRQPLKIIPSSHEMMR